MSEEWLNQDGFKITTTPGRPIDSKELFSSYNAVPHACVEVPNGMSTVSIRTMEGHHITLGFLPYEGSPNPRCVDIVHHTDRKAKTGAAVFPITVRSGVTGGVLFNSVPNTDNPAPVTLVVLTLRDLGTTMQVKTEPDSSIKCSFCNTTVPTIDDAINEGWLPQFWLDDVTTGNAVCAACLEAHTDYRDRDEPIIKPGHERFLNGGT